MAMFRIQCQMPSSIGVWTDYKIGVSENAIRLNVM